MKILIDECLPRKLKNEFSGHETFTVPQMGWAGKKNGELLALMTDNFEVFVTVDRNLQYQQPIEDIPIIFVVLVAANNKLESLKPLIPVVLEKLKSANNGEIVEVSQD